jgi:hypothetical protein
LDILKSTNYIQLETSKGLYGADNNIIEVNKTTAVNPKVRTALGLVYIRSYLQNFMPLINQPYEELLKVKFKYEDHDLIFNDWNSIIDILKKEDYATKCEKFKAYILSKAEISSNRTKEAVQKLRKYIGSDSTYINHSDINEPNWGNTFWGEKNYKKLMDLKEIYDPNDMFHHKYSIPLKINSGGKKYYSKQVSKRRSKQVSKKKVSKKRSKQVSKKRSKQVSKKRIYKK